MKSNRRNFIKYSGLAGVGVAVGNIAALAGESNIPNGFESKAEHFNMSGYAAPKLETVRIGFIGLGNRGPAAVKRMSKIEGVDIKGLCDFRPDKADAAKKLWKKPLIARLFIPATKMSGKKCATGKISISSISQRHGVYIHPWQFMQ